MNERPPAGRTRDGTQASFTPLLVLFVLAHFTHHIITALGAPLLPMMRSSFGLSYSQSGLLLTAFTVTYGLGHLPAGWLTDRINPIIMIFIGTAGVAVAGVLFGLAPTFPLLLGANALIGLAGSGYHPSASYLISTVAGPRSRGRALGVHVIGGSASYFLAPLLAGGISAVAGWRNTYILLSLPTLVLGGVMTLLFRKAAALNGPRTTEVRPEAGPGADTRFWIWLVSFLFLSTMTGALVGSAIGFIPLLLVDSFGLGAAAAAGMLAIIFSAGLWVAPLAGHVSDRLGKLPLLFGACAVAIPALYLLPSVSVGPLLYLILVVIGVFIFVRMPVSESFLFTHAPHRRRSTLLGVYFLGSSLGGGVLTPVIGWLIDVHGFVYGFRAVALTLFVTVLLSGVVMQICRSPHTGQGKRA